MKLNEGISSTGYKEHPEESGYYLFYRTDVDRFGNTIAFNDETRVHSQSHWGSGVIFRRIEISAL